MNADTIRQALQIILSESDNLNAYGHRVERDVDGYRGMDEAAEAIERAVRGIERELESVESVESAEGDE